MSSAVQKLRPFSSARARAARDRFMPARVEAPSDSAGLDAGRGDERLEIRRERAVEGHEVDLALERHQRVRIEHDWDVFDPIRLGLQ